MLDTPGLDGGAPDAVATVVLVAVDDVTDVVEDFPVTELVSGAPAAVVPVAGVGFTAAGLPVVTVVVSGCAWV